MFVQDAIAVAIIARVHNLVRVHAVQEFFI